MKLPIALALCTALFSTSAATQSVIYNDAAVFPRVSPINPLNERFLIKQRLRVDKITRKHFGQQLGNGKQNTELLQRVIDEKLIPRDEKLELQAMGVVLGDLFVDANKKLSWKLFEDELGISHAVCVEDTKHCIFPVTMISRRIEAGASPNVKRLYDKGLSAVKEFLPQLPFSD